MLHNLLRREDPDLLFLLETRIFSRQLDSIKRHGGYVGCLAMDSDGIEGGLALFWKASTAVTLISLFKHHIHASINTFVGPPQLFTGFYGHPDTAKREEI